MTGRAARVMREGALWGGASVLVLALHLGGALWLLERAEAAAPPGLPEPVFIDLAPAEETVQESVAPTEEPVEEAAEEPVEPEPQSEPEPEEVVEPLELPPLPELEPLEDMAELFPPAPPELETPPEVVLNSSARPQRRPEREPEPEPQRQAEPRRERREPEPQRQAEPSREEQPAPRQQQARRVEQGQQGATGRTGVSAQQLARDEASWKQQVGVCLLRSASRVSGASGARSTVALVIARNGRVQSASLTGSTGNPRVDREISRAMGRARCPAAPATLTKAAYQFVQPFAIQ